MPPHLEKVVRQNPPKEAFQTHYLVDRGLPRKQRKMVEMGQVIFQECITCLSSGLTCFYRAWFYTIK
jgi:Mg/Co/Ni transporter MgtE